jgi:hypothetical protein
MNMTTDVTDWKLILGVLTATGTIGAAAIAGVVSYRIARWNIRKDLEVELRREKLNAFKKLWAISQPLAKYGRIEPVNGETIARLSQELRKWYFEDGGMFLSDTSRDKYFEFQESLQNAIKSLKSGAANVALAEETFELLRTKGSELRTALRDSFAGFPQM